MEDGIVDFDKSCNDGLFLDQQITKEEQDNLMAFLKVMRDEGLLEKKNDQSFIMYADD